MKWFFCLFFSPFWMTAVAAVQLAILGQPEWVALATAELSHETGIELLERSRITQVLREHRLAEMGLSEKQLRKLFPHTDFFALVDAKRVLVFNAKNGFRLADGEHAGNVETIVGEMRRAMAKAGQTNPVYLATLAVHDVGVPRRFRDRLPEAVDAIERHLLANRHIQMLERRRLGMVAGERSLSGTAFALTPSARLLTFEFEPGETGGVVNVVIMIHDLVRQENGRLKINDVLQDDSATRQCANAILKHLLPAEEWKERE